MARALRWRRRRSAIRSDDNIRLSPRLIGEGASRSLKIKWQQERGGFRRGVLPKAGLNSFGAVSEWLG
jgi:hypothetical protein